ncbi:NAD(P)/FAD-dependent oxidoreductase [Novosphingobium sp. G106]|uniref:NAD(P)/FAD-dependent oxidoreductase n=1 Tax=Novosphingobium sp. G106 TaxID=2849500 RepID=UPI0020C26090|nr:NAD(P)/FAD-dependent oxidoreductase [Novosphingobium sp. G106]
MNGSESTIRFDRRVAIVTGAGGGLGRAYALELARRGARVVVNDIGPAAADKVVAEIAAQGGLAAANRDSVATRAGGRAIVDLAIEAFGRIDVLISNAGILRHARFDEMTEADINSVIDVHLKGSFHVGQPAFAAMKRQGYGRMLFTASSSGLFGHPWQASYAAAKAGIVGLANTIALEGKDHGVLCNVIMPNARTSMADSVDFSWKAEVSEVGAALDELIATPSGGGERLDADWVVPLAMHLVSEDSGMTHGIFFRLQRALCPRGNQRRDRLGCSRAAERRGHRRALAGDLRCRRARRAAERLRRGAGRAPDAGNAPMTDKLKPLADAYGIDPAVLRARYRAERDRRLTPDGLGQFVRIDRGHHHRYEEDPGFAGSPDREPLTDQIEIAVIGAGFGGLLLGAELRKAGIEGLRFIDRAGDFGGVWYWNRYPGAACDTEAPIYLPLLEELGVLPERKYAKGPEIHAHCKLIAETYDLYRDTCFHTDVTEIAWDEASGLWTIRTDRGDAMKARFVVVSAGVMDRPKLADLPGLEDFRGHAFHTSRWDYGYTGGTSDGGLTGLADKVVGIIGTGATAVQCVPHLGASAKQLYVFQRTPSSIDRRDDRALDPAEFASLEPGWQQKRMENFTALVGGAILEEDLVGDGWTSIPRNILKLLGHAQEMSIEIGDPYEVAPLADFVKMEEIRARVGDVVADKATAEALKPWYDRFCKRPCFHDDYLPTFNSPNVTLIDTEGHGVERITPNGVVAGGREYLLD